MRIVAMEWMSLDAVVQSPMYPDEDASGGFRHGGWHGPYLDEAAQEWVAETIASADAYLFGRGTYDRFAAYWPTAGEAERVISDPLNSRPKYVASQRPLDPVWEGAALLGEDARDAVDQIRAGEPGTLLLIGSPVLAQSLLEWNLIDELRLMIDPIVLGSGKRLFGPTGTPVAFELASSVATPAGALLVRYVRTKG